MAQIDSIRVVKGSVLVILGILMMQSTQTVGNAVISVKVAKMPLLVHSVRRIVSGFWKIIIAIAKLAILIRAKLYVGSVILYA